MELTVELDALRVDCIIGVLPEERLRAQPIEAMLRLHCNYQPSAGTERLDALVDYAVLARFAALLLKQAHFELLESAAYALATGIYTLAQGAEALRVGTVSVRLGKPEALRGQALPAVTLELPAGEALADFHCAAPAGHFTLELSPPTLHAELATGDAKHWPLR